MTFDPTTATGLRVNLYFSSLGRGGGNSAFRDVDTVTVIGTINRIKDPGNQTVMPLTGDERGPFTPSDDSPAAVLVYRSPVGGTEPLVTVEPLVRPGEDRTGFMAGFAVADGDSRFSRLTGLYGAVKVHDYSETWAAYNRMSAS